MEGNLSPNQTLSTAQHLLFEMCSELCVEFEPSESLLGDANELLDAVGKSGLVEPERRVAALYRQINTKFGFNGDHIREFLAASAKIGVVYNYHEKLEVNNAFDAGDQTALLNTLRSKGKNVSTADVEELLADYFSPISRDQTRDRLASELDRPTLIRKDSKERDWSAEILASIFAAFVYESVKEPEIHRFNDPLTDDQSYEPDFWKHLHRNFPRLFSRETALSIAQFDASSANSYSDLRDAVLGFARKTYPRLTNHGFVAFILDDLDQQAWELCGDLVLFAEKHIEIQTKRMFFRSAQIQAATEAHINNLDSSAARFDVMNTGFTFHDCFVIGDGQEQRLLILLQKNEADETLIPCPKCRSHNVRGNSYSSLGVKSWECSNNLCPDRSKFNRGKRYSFHQLLKQQAILHEENAIPVGSVRGWARDVQPRREDREILDMLVRHYSLVGDGIEVAGQLDYPTEFIGRNISSPKETNKAASPDSLDPQDFFSSSLFSRYCIEREPVAVDQEFRSEIIEGVGAYCGDAEHVLARMPENSIAGAVTSPPYYNAREYSQWPNIYAFLYDMYNINRQVFRTLRSGGYYLFNIFDYFDNEKSISLSAMGEKRMILGPYITDLFRRIGFKCEGNIVWDKGDIEGKRAFNNGNFSPYYQAPFNCWEHILVFRKPSPNEESKALTFPNVLRCKPVIKMVKGKNVHGHTAPFPESIPALLIDRLGEHDTVLDPFAGGMTTGAVANRQGKKAICIEMSPKYFELGVSKLRDGIGQLGLL